MLWSGRCFDHILAFASQPIAMRRRPGAFSPGGLVREAFVFMTRSKTPMGGQSVELGESAQAHQPLFVAGVPQEASEPRLPRTGGRSEILPLLLSRDFGAQGSLALSLSALPAPLGRLHQKGGRVGLHHASCATTTPAPLPGPVAGMKPTGKSYDPSCLSQNLAANRPVQPG